jgi:S1-C subfamily serine protease
LRSGDLVVAVNGTPVRSGTQLRNMIGLSRIGEEVTLTVARRGGGDQALAVRIEQASAAAAAATRPRTRQQR